MSGTVTVAMSNPYGRDGDNKITVDWISTVGGAASVGLASQFSTTELAKGYPGTPQPSKLTGFITKIETAPGLNGDLATSLPTALYDITLTDAYSNDVAAGNLANRSGTVAESYIPAIPIPVDTELTINVTNAGNALKGRMIIYLSEEQ